MKSNPLFCCTNCGEIHKRVAAVINVGGKFSDTKWGCNDQVGGENSETRAFNNFSSLHKCVCIIKSIGKLNRFSIFRFTFMLDTRIVFVDEEHDRNGNIKKYIGPFNIWYIYILSCIHYNFTIRSMTLLIL